MQGITSGISVGCGNTVVFVTPKMCQGSIVPVGKIILVPAIRVSPER